MRIPSLAILWILLSAGCGGPSTAPSAAAISIPLDAPQAVRQAAAGLDSPEPLTRAHAAGRLGGIEQGAEHATVCLLAVLQDPNPLVRAAAADSLGRVAGPGAVQPLIARLKDPEEDRDVRSRAAESLGLSQAVQALEPLVAALNDTVWHVRYHAAVALGRIGDARAAPPLELTARYDPDHSVRAVAKEALQMLIPLTNDELPLTTDQ